MGQLVDAVRSRGRLWMGWFPVFLFVGVVQREGDYSYEEGGKVKGELRREAQGMQSDPGKERLSGRERAANQQKGKNFRVKSVKSRQVSPEQLWSRGAGAEPQPRNKASEA